MGAFETFFASPGRAGAESIASDHLLVRAQSVLVDFLIAVSSLVLVLNPERQIVFASQDFLTYQGLDSPEPFLGKRPGEALNCIFSDSLPGGCGTSRHCSVCGAVRSIEKSRETQARAVEECRLTVKQPGGQGTLDLEVSSTPWVLEARPFTVVTVRDIGADKRKKSLERIFFHDILNLAGGLAGLLSILSDYPDLNAGKELVGMSRRTSQDILEEILAFQQLSRAESGELAVEPHPMDPCLVVKETADLMRFHPVAEGKNLTTDAGASQEPLVTDRLLLERVLVNMLKNAFEAVDQGDSVRLGCHREGAEVLFWVQNPGTMAPAVQLQVFQRSFSTKAADRGLGTYSMKLIGEKYLGGRVGFVSKGNETLFSLRLPGQGL